MAGLTVHEPSSTTRICTDLIYDDRRTYSVCLRVCVCVSLWGAAISGSRTGRFSRSRRACSGSTVLTALTAQTSSRQVQSLGRIFLPSSTHTSFSRTLSDPLSVLLARSLILSFHPSTYGPSVSRCSLHSQHSRVMSSLVNWALWRCCTRTKLGRRWTSCSMTVCSHPDISIGVIS